MDGVTPLETLQFHRVCRHPPSCEYSKVDGRAVLVCRAEYGNRGSMV